jgi:hypothetical protein
VLQLQLLLLSRPCRDHQTLLLLQPLRHMLTK